MLCLFRALDGAHIVLDLFFRELKLLAAARQHFEGDRERMEQEKDSISRS